ncbi:MAG TPA: DegT/DnrJ/EryC1/StrS family aminotransferase [Candidatus Hydrothermia bacterium]|nr:DegT/DnrJ/EryC1/StrS family aminotransferase [Candidatus Hydrothermia bacterium]
MVPNSNVGKPFKIPLFETYFDDEDIESVVGVLRSGWISTGPKTEELERAFAEYYGVHYALFVSSGTASLHLAYLAAGINKNSTVVLPSFTYISTLTPLMWIGCRFRFADIQSIEKPVVAPDTINEALKDDAEYVIYLPYAGFLDGIDHIKKFCDDKGVKLLEDASHCHGSCWNGIRAGNLGIAAGMSLYANKNITTGEGGVLLTNDELIYSRAKLLRSQCITSTSFERYQGLEMDYDIVEIGYTYRATEIQAALGLSQLKKLGWTTERRRELVGLYRRLLEDVEEIVIPFEDYRFSGNYIFSIFSKVDRDALRGYLFEKGIQTSIHYKPLHLFKAVGREVGPLRLPVTEKAYKMQITLPLFPTMREEWVEYIVGAIKDGVVKIKHSGK